ncbi:MAG: hypothetical protein ACFFDN_34540, partial [Candidatus Hodarchaeota archaeon]
MKYTKLFVLLMTILLSSTLIPTINPEGSRFQINLQSLMTFSQPNIDIHQSAWQKNGIPICNADGHQGWYQGGLAKLCSDGSGGAIIVWGDYRNPNYEVYSQRVNASGYPMWAANGTVIANASPNGDSDPEIISDDSGGAIIVWEYYTGTFDIYAQRINSTGDKKWGTNGIVVSNANISQWNQKLCTDGNGGAIITWQDDRDYPLNAHDIYAQRIDENGSAKWTPNGTIICNAIYGGSHENPQICSDGAGGAIITWMDNRTSPTDWNIYAQKINSSGLTEWTPNGTIICNAINTQSGVVITSDGAGGAIIAWGDDRFGNIQIFAQRINSSGQTEWTANGTVISPFNCNNGGVDICSDDVGGAIMAWRDNRGDSWGDIYGQRVNSSGYAQWGANGIGICTAVDNQYLFKVCSDDNGGAFIVWRDKRSGNLLNYDIYAQHVNSSGNMRWTPNGAGICVEGSDQDLAYVCATTIGEAIFAWIDKRNYATTQWDLYIESSTNIQEEEEGMDLILLLLAMGMPQPGILDVLLNPYILGGISLVVIILIVIIA